MNNECKNREEFLEECIDGEKVVNTLNKSAEYFENNVDLKNPVEILAYFDLVTREITELQQGFTLKLIEQLFITNNSDLGAYIDKTSYNHVKNALGNIKDEKLKELLKGLVE